MYPTKILKKLAIAAGLSLGLTSCSLFQDPYVQYGAVGGLGGAAIGAGTGALVGTLLANGDVAASAMLGGGIGLAAGIVAGVAYRAYQEDSEIDENNERIRANYEYIVARQYEIDRMREALVEDSYRVQPSKVLRGEIYVGETVGTLGY